MVGELVQLMTINVFENFNIYLIVIKNFEYIFFLCNYKKINQIFTRKLQFVSIKKIILENDKAEEFDQLIEELYPEGLTETALNDILWFDYEWLFETLGIELQED